MTPEDIKHRLVELFKNSLQNLGYRYVEDFKPASPTFDPYYHLIYAATLPASTKKSRKPGESRDFYAVSYFTALKTGN